MPVADRAIKHGGRVDGPLPSRNDLRGHLQNRSRMFGFKTKKAIGSTCFTRGSPVRVFPVHRVIISGEKS